MATRLYVSATDANLVPSVMRGAWTKTGTTTTYQLGPKMGASFWWDWTLGASAATVLSFRTVSAPLLSAGALQGSVSWVLGAGSDSSLDAYWHLHLWVTVGNTDQLRGTVISNYAASSGAFPTERAGHGGGPVNLSPVSVQAGDRLVAEWGYHGDGGWFGSSYSAALGAGANGTGDLGAGSATAYDDFGWIEFTDDSRFRAPLPSATPEQARFFPFF